MTSEPRHPIVQKQIWGYNNEGHLVPVWITWDGCWLLDDPSDEALTLVEHHPGKKRKWNTEILVEMLDTGKGVEEVMVPMDPKPLFVKTTLNHEDGDLTPAWVNFNASGKPTFYFIVLYRAFLCFFMLFHAFQ